MMKWLWSVFKAFPFVAAGITSGCDEAPSQDDKETVSDRVQRIYFLKDLELQDGIETRLVLTSVATGAGERVVNDPAVLTAQRDIAYYTNDTQGAGRLLLISMLFLSPPGTSPNDTFAYVVQGDEVIHRATCFSRYCRGDRYADIPPHEKHIDALLGASQPIEERFETFEDYAEYQARIREIRADPESFFTYPPADENSPRGRYEGHFRLHLPGVIWPADSPDEPFDAEAYIAGQRARIEAALPGAGSRYMFNDFSVHKSERVGLVVTANRDRPFLQNGEPVLLQGIDFYQISVRIDGPHALYTAIRDGALEGVLDTSYTTSAALDARFEALVREVTGTENWDEYAVKPDTGFSPDAEAFFYRPNRWTLYYLTVVPENPSKP